MLKLVGLTQSRRNIVADMVGLHEYVNNHCLTIVWDTHISTLEAQIDRGVLWTQSDGLAGFFTLDSDGLAHVVLETGTIQEW